MGDSDRSSRRVLGDVDLGDVEEAIGEMGLFAEATTVADVEQRLRSQVALEVQAMCTLVEDFDAFDVIELMRLREHPVSPVLALAPGFDGSSAALELVAAVLLARSSRKLSPIPREDTRPHEAINELHDRAKRLLRLATYRAKACEMLRGSDPLVRLSAEYQAYLVGVRSLQYASVQADHEIALFGSDKVGGLLREALGFTHSDFVTVNEAVVRLYSDTLTGIRDDTGAIFMAMRDGHEPTDEETEFLQRSIVDMMFLPAERAAFGSDAIAERCQLDAELVATILDWFSVDFDPYVDATDVAFDFLHARNLFAHRGLVRSGDRYLLVTAPIGGDSFRAVAEDALKPTTSWNKYNDARKVVSEGLAAAALEQALGRPPLALGLQYFAPAAGRGPEVLDRTCSDLTAVGKVVESDALFVVDDVAVCLEVKARSVAEPARRGDLARLRTEIKNIMGEGAHQARRLEAMIRHNGGLWLADRTWLDLRQVREVHTVVAGLDYFGPLGVALGDLAGTKLLGEGRMPWVTSIHDLEVISRVVDRPTEFLLYLRRRANSGVMTHYRGSDELDLFMLFMNGGLFVEEDPDEIQRRYPRTTPPTKAARERYLQASQPTLIGTFTDPLDAWMYSAEGTNPHAADKPEFNVDPSAAEVVDFLADGCKPGWLRAGTDLLALSGEAQRRLTKNIEKMTAQTRADRTSHSLVQGFPGLEGYITFFAATVPDGADREAEADKLRLYMRAKKHQVGSDRSLGLLVNHLGQIVKVMYMNDLPTDDPELEELGTAIGLQETWARTRRPPSVSAKKQKRRAKRGRSR